jgi:hypothetical protein
MDAVSAVIVLKRPETRAEDAQVAVEAVGDQVDDGGVTCIATEGLGLNWLPLDHRLSRRQLAELPPPCTKTLLCVQ